MKNVEVKKLDLKLKVEEYLKQEQEKYKIYKKEADKNQN